MIRRAEFGDVPRLVEILSAAHARSPYNGIVNIDIKEAKALLVNSIQRHGGQRIGSTFVEVAERYGTVEGFIVGLLQRVYHIGDRLTASDLFWIGTSAIHPRDAARLMKRMIAWAEACPGVVEIQCGATDAAADSKRTGQLLLHMGLTPFGGIYRKEVKR